MDNISEDKKLEMPKELQEWAMKYQNVVINSLLHTSPFQEYYHF